MLSFPRMGYTSPKDWDDWPTNVEIHPSHHHHLMAAGSAEEQEPWHWDCSGGLLQNIEC